MSPLPAPTCPQCSAELKLAKTGELDFWSCPAGHGLGFTITEAYGRVQEDEISKIWEGAKATSAGTKACPMCATPMVTVTIGVDPDEAAEGKPGDQPDTGQVTLDVCRNDQVVWFDPGELEQLPRDLENPEPTPEQLAKEAELAKTASDALQAFLSKYTR
ncbi:MAG: hypothetical protein U0V73_06330 [Acidimicrobiia bacterium]